MKNPLKLPDLSEKSTGPSDLVNTVKLRTFVWFIGALMVLHSFFGSVYRIPSQIERNSRELSVLTTTAASVQEKVVQVEKIIAVNQSALAEANNLKKEVAALERQLLETRQLTGDISRVQDSIRELSILLASTGTKLTELSVMTANLKEMVIDNREAIEAARRRGQ